MAPVRVQSLTQTHNRKREDVKLGHPAGRRAFTFRAAFVVHAIALAWYLWVWLWHFTPAAVHLPGARGFGWFFKYLTFCSYTVQLVQLSVCCWAHLAQEAKRKEILETLADDISCAVFGLANCVTLLFFGIDAATRDVEEAGMVAKPVWLGPSVHIFNSVTVWADLLVAQPRSFSRRAQYLSLGLVALYINWILVCSHFNRIFPYPFLNKLPWPQGFCGVAAGALVLFYLVFHLGRHLSALLIRLKNSALATASIIDTPEGKES